MNMSLSFLMSVFLISGCCSQFVHCMDTLVQLQSEILKVWNSEWQNRRCAELEAAEQNILDAQRYLTRRYPKLRNAIASAGLEVLNSIDEECEAPTLPRVRIQAYKQANPDLPITWPNWFIHFVPMGA